VVMVNFLEVEDDDEGLVMEDSRFWLWRLVVEGLC
jgi:hypothetical protein